MKLFKRSRSLATLVITSLVLAGATSGAFAQSYPAKPVRIIVPLAPGGGTDIIGRTIAQALSESLGQSFFVENRAGAGGNIGMEATAKAPSDGYTLLVASLGLAINPSLYRKAGFDPLKDFSLISLVTSGPFVLVVHPSIPATSVKQLVALVKSRPGDLNYASAGSGSGPHLSAELFKSITRVQMVHVPYKGGGPALIDVLSGQVSLMFPSMPAALSHIRAGKLRALAVTTERRSTAAPDIPTVSESGVPGYASDTWYGLLAPARTPREIVLALNSGIVKSVQTPDMRERLAKLGLEPVGSSPEQFSAYLKAEMVKWAKVINEAGIRAD